MGLDKVGQPCLTTTYLMKNINIINILSVLAFTCIFGLFGCGVNTSPGTAEKVGVIVRVAKVGLVSQTWEAQIIRGGLTGGTGVTGTAPFDFTIEGANDAELAKEYMKSGTEVLLVYRSEGFFSAFRTESNGQFLVSIAPLKR